MHNLYYVMSFFKQDNKYKTEKERERKREREKENKEKQRKNERVKEIKIGSGRNAISFYAYQWEWMLKTFLNIYSVIDENIFHMNGDHQSFFFFSDRHKKQPFFYKMHH